MSRRSRGRRGETLVEVLAAGTILLILLAALHTGVRFAAASLQKTREILENAAALQEDLRTPDGLSWIQDVDCTFSLHSDSPDGGQGDVLFTFRIGCYRRTAPDGDGSRFFLYGPAADPPPAPGSGP